MKTPEWNISDAIKREVARAGSYSKLADDINLLSKDPRKMDRRKLAAIANRNQFTLSSGELAAFDSYFAQHGSSLGELFSRQSLLKSMAENEKCVALVGAFPRNEEERNDVSLWDVKAFQELLEGMYKFREVTHSTLQDVPFFNLHGKHNRALLPIAKIPSKPRLSVCYIGSTRSNVATEVVLSDMFGIQPFIAARQQPPFKFYWQSDPDDDPERTDAGFFSAFQATDEEVGKIDSGFPPSAPKRPPKRGRHVSALLVEGQLLKVVPRISSMWEDYGILAAQKQGGDRIRVVVAGLTGPSTYASARACRTNIGIPAPPESGVLWAVVKATVRPGNPGVGDSRWVERIDLVGEPHIWPRPN